MASRKNQKTSSKAATPKTTAPPTTKPATLKANQPAPGTWLEENWSSWLRPLVFISLAGTFMLLYSANLISDFRAAALIMLVLVGLVWFLSVSSETARFPEDKRTAFYGLSALVALFAWVPVLFAFYPGEPRLVGELKKKGDAIDLSPLGSTQQYMIVAGGALAAITENNREVDYILEGHDGNKKVTMVGKIEQRMEQVKSRRGVAGQTLKIHSQDKKFLILDPSKPLKLLSEIDEKSLPEGVHIAVYSPPIGGPWLLFGSLLFYLLLMVYDLKNVAEKGKGYLAAGGGVLLVGSLVFCTNAVPYASFTATSDLAQTALGAAMLGGVLGSFGGLLLAFLMGKYIPRPPLHDDFAEARAKALEE